MKELIRTLCAERGVSGDESRVRSAILARLKGRFDYTIDPLGSLIVTKQGPSGKKIALFAHMDEVGVLVTRVTGEGLLTVSPIGIDPRALFGRRMLVGEAGIPAVVGSKAWHHLEEAERDAALKTDGMYLDIGACSREEAGALVSPGDAAVFDAPFVELGEDMITSRALDDRIGCALLLELLESDLPVGFTAVFTCGEEAGLFGAEAAAKAVGAEIAVILETTTAGDADGADENKTVCSLGRGPVVSFADKGALYDRGLYRAAFETADKHKIPIQTKEGVFGGNEARVVQRAGRGARTCAVSVPCRYLHSASCTASLTDIENTRLLLHALLPVFAAL